MAIRRRFSGEVLGWRLGVANDDFAALLGREPGAHDRVLTTTLRSSWRPCALVTSRLYPGHGMPEDVMQQVRSQKISPFPGSTQPGRGGRVFTSRSSRGRRSREVRRWPEGSFRGRAMSATLSWPGCASWPPTGAAVHLHPGDVVLRRLHDQVEVDRLRSALGGGRAPALRLAEGPLRPVVADHPCAALASLLRRGPGAGRPRHAGHAGHDEASTATFDARRRVRPGSGPSGARVPQLGPARRDLAALVDLTRRVRPGSPSATPRSPAGRAVRHEPGWRSRSTSASERAGSDLVRP